MKVRYTPRAFADREQIFAYLDERNPCVAREVKAFIKRRIATLAQNPGRSPAIKELGVQAHWLGRYPYIIYYRTSEMRCGSCTSGTQSGSHGAGNDHPVAVA